jgi:hypothetical protein
MIPAAKTDVNHTIHAHLNPSLGMQTGLLGFAKQNGKYNLYKME